MGKALMIQGTMSSAGKSFTAAALCRIYSDMGLKVAPFKSQNMALNSYVTKDGKEIGRAQAMQAEAARCEATVNMNPILLKPNSDTGSQVMLCGKIYGNMTATEYYSHKSDFVPYIKKAFEDLKNENDVVILEGAGSPAEINLLDCDIANMGMAEIADCPVILVADIDRGGVFAQIYGTCKLLPKKYNRRIKGIIINKFRGQKSILDPGILQIEKLTGIPVLGVLPYIDIILDDEDSLSERLLNTSLQGGADIAVLRLPKISNFTDFNIFEIALGKGVRYIKNKNDFKNPDILIIPGSKNTVSDMIFLRESGLEAKIKQFAAGGGKIFGICGGYQILGKSIEENGKKIAGLDLLNVLTKMEDRKKTVRGKYKITGLFKNEKIINGYEIHMGKTTLLNGAKPFAFDENGNVLGACNENIYGTYIHGFFDDIAKDLLENYNLSNKNKKNISIKEFKESQYQKLAECFRENLDIEKINGIINSWKGLQ